MVNINKTTEKIWWIVTSTDKTIIHYGELLPNTELISGQDELETFNSEDSWIGRLLELGITIEDQPFSNNNGDLSPH